MLLRCPTSVLGNQDREVRQLIQGCADTKQWDLNPRQVAGSPAVLTTLGAVF